VVELVDGWLLPRYARSLKTHRWDPQWFEYVEVIDRLDTLRRAWEHFRPAWPCSSAITNAGA